MLRILLGLQALQERLVVGDDERSGILKTLFKKKNRKLRKKVAGAVRSRYQDYVEDGGELTFWQWLWENREEILEFIMLLISIFSAL